MCGTQSPCDWLGTQNPTSVAYGKAVKHGMAKITSLGREGEGVDDRAELLICAHARNLLRHQLTEHSNHREPAVLQLLELLALELGRILGLEAKEGGLGTLTRIVVGAKAEAEQTAS